MNMGKLGSFTFYIKKNEYKKLTETFSVSFGSFKPIKGQEMLTDSGGYEHKITLNGVAVVQPIGSLKTLESMAKNREVIRLTTVDIDIDVVITALTLEKSHFIDDGKYTVQTYNITIKEVFNDIA